MSAASRHDLSGLDGIWPEPLLRTASPRTAAPVSACCGPWSTAVTAHPGRLPVAGRAGTGRGGRARCSPCNCSGSGNASSPRPDRCRGARQAVRQVSVDSTTSRPSTAAPAQAGGVDLVAEPDHRAGPLRGGWSVRPTWPACFRGVLSFRLTPAEPGDSQMVYPSWTASRLPPGQAAHAPVRNRSSRTRKAYSSQAEQAWLGSRGVRGDPVGQPEAEHRANRGSRGEQQPRSTPSGTRTGASQCGIQHPETPQVRPPATTIVVRFAAAVRRAVIAAWTTFQQQA